MKNCLPFRGKSPAVEKSVFLAVGSVLIGDVQIGSDSSIWYNTVLRGDMNSIRIGKKSNVQDLSIVHVDSKKFATLIGDEVTIGHDCIIHGCTIGDRVLVGMGAILMNGVVVGEDCIIGAGALLTEGLQVPPRSLILGSPAKVKRELKPEEMAFLKESAEHYVNYAREHQKIPRGA